MSELKPCPFCGSDRIGTNANTVKVTIWCEMCGARITRGARKQYASIGNCKRYVEPCAVEAWNRRANDENATYIQQLERELAAVKRERDALSKDLKAACKLFWSDDSMHCCKFCEHENEPKDTGYCDKCANGNRLKFKPAALCQENMEVQDGK